MTEKQPERGWTQYDVKTANKNSTYYPKCHFKCFNCFAVRDWRTLTKKTTFSGRFPYDINISLFGHNFNPINALYRKFFVNGISNYLLFKKVASGGGYIPISVWEVLIFCYTITSKTHHHIIKNFYIQFDTMYILSNSLQLGKTFIKSGLHTFFVSIYIVSIWHNVLTSKIEFDIMYVWAYKKRYKKWNLSNQLGT